jgi:formylmethanofuran dehydrogenase subunit D
MKEIRLHIKKRAFPSHGRVRVNAHHLPDLDANEGDQVDLINEPAQKMVTVTLIADSMVGEGDIRASEEDLKSLGMKEGDEVLIRKTPPVQEKVKKAVAGARTTMSEQVGKLDNTIKKTAGNVKDSAAKTAGTVSKKTHEISGTIEKAATDTTETIRKRMKGKEWL